MFYGPELATEEKKIALGIFLIWYVYYTWFSEYVKYLIGYSVKKKCIGVIEQFVKVSLDSRNNIQCNYYSVINCDGKKYLKKRSFSDKIGKEIIFVETNKEKKTLFDNEDILYGEAYDTKYKVPYPDIELIFFTSAALIILGLALFI